MAAPLRVGPTWGAGGENGRRGLGAIGAARPGETGKGLPEISVGGGRIGRVRTASPHPVARSGLESARHSHATNVGRLQARPTPSNADNVAGAESEGLTAARVEDLQQAGTPAAFAYESIYADWHQAIANGKPVDNSFVAFLRNWVDRGLRVPKVERLYLEARRRQQGGAQLDREQSVVMGQASGGEVGGASCAAEILDLMVRNPEVGWSGEFASEAVRHLAASRGRDDALNRARRLIEAVEDPKVQVPVLCVVGSLHWKPGERLQRAAALQKAMKREPATFFAIKGPGERPSHQLCRLLAKMGAKEDLRQLAEEALAVDAPQATLALLAKTCDEAGCDREVVVTLYRRYLAGASPRHLDLSCARRLHEIYLNAGNEEGCRFVVDMLHHGLGDEPKFALEIGRLYMAVGSLGPAADYLSKYARRFPASGTDALNRLRLELGNAYLLREEWLSAVEQFLAAAESGGLGREASSVAKEKIRRALAQVEGVPREVEARLERLGALSEDSTASLLARIGRGKASERAETMARVEEETAGPRVDSAEPAQPSRLVAPAAGQAHGSAVGRIGAAHPTAMHERVPGASGDEGLIGRVTIGSPLPPIRTGPESEGFTPVRGAKAKKVRGAEYYEVERLIHEFRLARVGGNLAETARRGRELLPRIRDIGEMDDRYVEVAEEMLYCYIRLGQLEKADALLQETSAKYPETTLETESYSVLRQILEEAKAAAAERRK